MIEPRFVADVHLGKLAKLLQLPGFDTLYNNTTTVNELIQISRNNEVFFRQETLP